jgi:hypothetical protein
MPKHGIRSTRRGREWKYDKEEMADGTILREGKESIEYTVWES